MNKQDLLNVLKTKIKGTGGEISKNDFLFKHLVLTEKEEEQIKELSIPLKELAELLEVDFISVKRIGTISFIHITQTDNEEFISKFGLRVKEDEFIPDLGEGIYVISRDVDFFDGLDNLQTYVSEGYEEDRVLFVTGNYEGEHTECIYGIGHKGYIVLLTHKIAKNNLDYEDMDIEDFLMYY